MTLKKSPAPDEVDEELVSISIPEEAGPVWVTPELATLWMSRNRKNRKVREHVVNALARDMATENWRYTGEAIKFDVNGTLLDGQHRLRAIIKSGATVKILVVPGLPTEAQSFMDAGARRSAGDALAFRDEVNASLLASTIRFAIRFEGRRSSKDAISHAEIIAYLSTHPDIRRYVGLTMRHLRKIDMKPSVFAYALWRLYQLDEIIAGRFLIDIAEMRSNGQGDPVYTLLSRFRSARRNREILSPIVELSFIFRAWNAYRSGAQLKVLKVPMSDSDVVEPK